uniref:YEATS domain containing 4 n=1 Tax=Sinocyclocheilus rhinocerous TaxID=307959 RepID=A0A673KVE0_9TELE
MFKRMAEFGPDSGGRVKEVTVVKPIVFGNTMVHTHQWTVYVKPYRNEVTLYHLLKLFQSDSSAMPKKTVVSEFYDEMVRIQTDVKILCRAGVKNTRKLEAAKKKTSLEISELKERLKASRENINFLKGEIRRLEEEDQMKDH